MTIINDYSKLSAESPEDSCATIKPEEIYYQENNVSFLDTLCLGQFDISVLIRS